MLGRCFGKTGFTSRILLSRRQWAWSCGIGALVTLALAVFACFAGKNVRGTAPGHAPTRSAGATPAPRLEDLEQGETAASVALQANPGSPDEGLTLLESAAVAEAKDVEPILQEFVDLRDRLLAEVADPNLQARIRMSFEEHRRRIQRCEESLSSASDDEDAARLLTDMAVEYWYMFYKTPARLPVRQDYLRQAMDALEQATRRGRSAVAAYYLADHCHTYSQSGFPTTAVGGKPVNGDLAIEYYLLTYDLLAASEFTRRSPADTPHPFWLVRGAMQGLERALQEQNRTAEFAPLKSRLVAKYQGTVLGRQLNDSFGPGRRPP